ncbi:protein bps1, partial [Quercus suber]
RVDNVYGDRNLVCTLLLASHVEQAQQQPLPSLPHHASCCKNHHHLGCCHTIALPIPPPPWMLSYHYTTTITTIIAITTTRTIPINVYHCIQLKLLTTYIKAIVGTDGICFRVSGHEFVNLLDICNAFSSEISRVNQGHLLVQCVLHNLDSSSSKQFIKARSSLDAWRQHIISKELEAVDTSVKKSYPMIQDGVDPIEGLSEGLDLLTNQYDDFFDVVLTRRDALLCNVKDSGTISDPKLGCKVVERVQS